MVHAPLFRSRSNDRLFGFIVPEAHVKVKLFHDGKLFFFIWPRAFFKQALSTNSLQMCIMGAYKIEKTGGGIWLLQEMKI